ncbi:MAG: TdeIII family type II restriction endonuclease [Melioribacteraceae bacterium]
MIAISNDSKEFILSQIDKVIMKYLKKAESEPIANSGNPFVMAILKDFEPLLHRIHGLKTSIGSEMEKIAECIAVDVWGKENVKRKCNVNVKLPRNVFQSIDTIINNLSNAKNLSNYLTEKELIISSCNSPDREFEEHTYEFDLQLYDKFKKRLHFLEMKGPDPNTTEVPGAKKRLLVAMAYGYIHILKGKGEIDSQIGIYYNNKFPRPYKNPKVHYYFDPNGGVLVQEAFWNFIGKNENTYTELIKLFEDYGLKNKKRIWDGFSKLIISNN